MQIYIDIEKVFLNYILLKKNKKSKYYIYLKEVLYSLLILLIN